MIWSLKTLQQPPCRPVVCKTELDLNQGPDLTPLWIFIGLFLTASALIGLHFLKKKKQNSFEIGMAFVLARAIPVTPKNDVEAQNSKLLTHFFFGNIMFQKNLQVRNSRSYHKSCFIWDHFYEVQTLGGCIYDKTNLHLMKSRTLPLCLQLAVIWLIHKSSVSFRPNFRMWHQGLLI